MWLKSTASITSTHDELGHLALQESEVAEHRLR